MKIKVGRYDREIDVRVTISKEDTRWHVYPQRPKRLIQAIVLGEVYQFRSGLWFRSVVCACGGPEAPDRLLARIGATAEKLESAVK